MNDFATAAEATWLVWLFIACLAGLALLLLWACNRGHFAPWQDHQERNPYTTVPDAIEQIDGASKAKARRVAAQQRMGGAA